MGGIYSAKFVKFSNLDCKAPAHRKNQNSPDFEQEAATWTLWFFRKINSTPKEMCCTHAKKVCTLRSSEINIVSTWNHAKCALRHWQNLENCVNYSSENCCNNNLNILQWYSVDLFCVWGGLTWYEQYLQWTCGRKVKKNLINLNWLIHGGVCSPLNQFRLSHSLLQKCRVSKCLWFLFLVFGKCLEIRIWWLVVSWPINKYLQ